MKGKILFLSSILLLGLPGCLLAQGISGQTGGLQTVLDRVYDDMMPLCSGMIDAARGIAGFAALWYIANKVWRQIASAEPIDVYPLLRPFALGMAILVFPAVLWMMNGVLGLTVAGTQQMVKNSDQAIIDVLKQKEIELKKSVKWKLFVGQDGSGDREQWYVRP